MPSLFLTLAGINGFLAVGIGAFGAHALRDRLTPELASTFQTGVQYHMFHTLALFGVGLLLLALPQATLPRISGYLFTLGIVLFSGSLYVWRSPVSAGWGRLRRWVVSAFWPPGAVLPGLRRQLSCSPSLAYALWAVRQLN